MSKLSPENITHIFQDRAETELNIEKQREILMLKVEPIIQRGINSGIIKQNETLLLNPNTLNDWSHSTKPAVYEIVESVDNKTRQQIVYMSIKYGKKIDDSSDEIKVKQPMINIFVKDRYFVFIKDNDIDHPQYIPTCLEEPETHILQHFEN